MNSSSFIQLRHCFKVFSGSTPESGKGHYWDGEIHWVTPEDLSDLKEGYRLFDTKRKITPEGYKETGVTLVPADSIILSKRAPIGLLALLGVEACSNQGCFLLVPKEGIIAEFYYYYLLAKKDYLQILGRGSTFMELSLDDIKSLKIPNYSDKKQSSIANYLDSQLLVIDGLIKKKEHQLELLSEKRQTLITQAVTKGVNPKAKMKVSGIDWLGDIPEHWAVMKLKYVASINDETLSESTEDDLEINYVEISDVDYMMGIKNYTTLTFKNAPSRARRIVRKGDIIISTVRTYLKAISQIKSDKIPLIVSTGFAVIRPLQINSGFLGYYTLSNSFISRTIANSVGVSYPAINSTTLSNFEVPIPSLDEQNKIVSYIENGIIQIDLITQKTIESIHLLNEKRAALITAAVAGQIEIPAV